MSVCGLALEGGGARGAFHLGAVKALLARGWEYSCVAGTSVGAINAAILAQGDFELAYQLWQTLDVDDFFNVSPVMVKNLLQHKLDRQTLAYAQQKLKVVLDNKGMDTKLIRQMLEVYIDEDKLRASAVDFGMVTVSLSDFKPMELYKEDIPQGALIDYLLASARLPVFKSELLDGKQFLDGGFWNNCPVDMVAAKGCKHIFAIRTMSPGIVKNVRPEGVTVQVIRPSEELGLVLDFTKASLHKSLTMGYYDTLRALDGYRGKKYYINNLEPAAAFALLAALPEKGIAAIDKISGFAYNYPYSRRRFFEQLLPELFLWLRLPKKAAYDELLIALLEQVAQDEGVPRFAVYDFNRLLSLVQDALRQKKKTKVRIIAKKSPLAALVRPEEDYLRMAAVIISALKTE